MNHQTIDDLFNVVRQNPDGITAKVAAKILGWPVTAASARLGKLAVYGVIDRRPNPYGRSNEYRYLLKRHDAIAAE